MILVLGIVSIVCCPLVGPVAWIMGKGDMAKVKSGEIAKEAETMTFIGMILGIVGTVILVLDLIGGCVYAILAIFVLGAAGSAIKNATFKLIEPLFGIAF
jgi:hypothetical protein